MQLHRALIALIVLVATPLVAADAAAAQAARHEGTIDSSVLAASSWHGRPIQRPAPAAPATVADTDITRLAGWSAGPVVPGAGYAAPRGSGRVREVQHRLLQLGYRPGPADGRFGPRTHGAVLAFQRKHGLREIGAVEAGTLVTLRRRTTEQTGSPSQTSAAAPVWQPEQVQAPPRFDLLPALMLGLLSLVVLGVVSGIRRVLRRPVLRPATVESGPAATVASAGRAQRMRIALPAAARRGIRLRPGGGTHRGGRAVGYASAPGGAPDGSDTLKGQAEALRSACEERNLRLAEVVNDIDRDDARARERPGLDYALGRIAAREASTLVVCSLGHLSRSVVELSRVLERLLEADGRLVALDPGIDTATPAGRLAARTALRVGTLEREYLSDRTRSGLEAARRKGARVGRASVADRPELRDRIARMRAEGMTLQAIAEQLNAEGVPTVRGGLKWRPSSVHSAAGGTQRPRRSRRSAQDDDGEDPATEGAP